MCLTIADFFYLHVNIFSTVTKYWCFIDWKNLQNVHDVRERCNLQLNNYKLITKQQEASTQIYFFDFDTIDEAVQASERYSQRMDAVRCLIEDKLNSTTR